MGISKAVYDGKTLIDLTQDTVTETKLLSGYTAHKADGTIINGGITNHQGGTYTPTTSDQTVVSDQYLYNDVVLKGDTDLLAENIKAGVTIFGVTGTYIPTPPVPVIQNATQLPSARIQVGTGNVGDYALIIGGASSNEPKTSSKYDHIISYNITGTMAVSGYIPFANCFMGVTNTSNHCVVGGGLTSATSTAYNMTDKVIFIDESLTTTTLTATLTTPVRFPGSIRVGDSAVFAGGNSAYNPSKSNGRTDSRYVMAFSDSGTKTALTMLSAARSPISSNIGNNYEYGAFITGTNGPYGSDTDGVYAINDSFTVILNDISSSWTNTSGNSAFVSNTKNYLVSIYYNYIRSSSSDAWTGTWTNSYLIGKYVDKSLTCADLSFNTINILRTILGVDQITYNSNNNISAPNFYTIKDGDSGKQSNLKGSIYIDTGFYNYSSGLSVNDRYFKSYIFKIDDNLSLTPLYTASSTYDKFHTGYIAKNISGNYLLIIGGQGVDLSSRSKVYNNAVDMIYLN